LSLTPGTRLGVYEITAPIGAGGMGQVFRARDTRLDRDVAIKILPEAFAHDADRLARFQREAKTLASLNHPNIAGIYGLEESGVVTALVMELVEGEDLSQRIACGAIPLDEALPIAKQIAKALEAAHERGIIHRDLKPANIKVRADGTVKVLDFGLAKALDPPRASNLDVTNSPTLSLHATQAGVVLGTAPYMSPEQALGKSVDKRSDVWAFGVVLFEMLTGQRAFEGDGFSTTVAAVMMTQPPWHALPTATPTEVRRLLLRCLQKEPTRRLRDIGDALLDLDDASTEQSTTPQLGRPVHGSGTWRYAGWGVAALALILAATVSFRHRADAMPIERPVIRASIVLPGDQKLASGDSAYPMAISNDGGRIAYVSEVEGRSQLYVRELAALEAKAVPGTSGAAHPFFSPDGQWVGFLADGALQKAAVSGGSPLRICNVSAVSMGATWGPDNTIVLALRGAGLSKVSASGGTLEPLAGASPGMWPEFLPDGKTVLYTTGTGGAGSALAALSLDGRSNRIVARTTDAQGAGPAVLGTGGGIAQARFVSSGYLVYGQSPGIVRAIPFDVTSLTTTGSPVPLVDSIERGRNGGAVYFAVSRTGLLVYASTGERHQLVWVDRSGTATPVSADRAAFRNPRVSPDGRRIVVAANDQTRRSDIWIYDAERGTKNRLTTTGHNLAPVWTPDGAHITFAGRGLVQVPADGGGGRDVLLPSEQVLAHLARGTTAYPTAWSPDGRTLLFQADEEDMWAIQRGLGSAPVPLLVRPAHDYGGAFSPDGRWIAYTSDESGRSEVYVAHYPDLGSRVTVSTEGGAYPRWSREGRELFYRQGDALMAAAVDTTREFRAERPQRLFAGQFTGTGGDAAFDVSPDGKRFAMIKSDEASTLQQLTLVQNWLEELSARAATK
jgi:eukaryotic-like serine/threonine-protein kinase